MYHFIPDPQGRGKGRSAQVKALQALGSSAVGLLHAEVTDTRGPQQGGDSALLTCLSREWDRPWSSARGILFACPSGTWLDPRESRWAVSAGGSRGCVAGWVHPVCPAPNTLVQSQLGYPQPPSQPRPSRLFHLTVWFV